MHDDLDLADLRQVIAELSLRMPDMQSLDEVLQRAQITKLQVDLAPAPPTELWANVIKAALQGGTLTRLFETLADRGLPVPTPEELSETEAALREHVLPETSKKELQEAVSEIPADPEKLKLVASLSKAIDEATGVQGSSPWVVFVLAFYICLKINPDPVTSLGTAIAVAVLMRSAKQGK